MSRRAEPDALRGAGVDDPGPLGHVSGEHFNPAISLGLAMGRRFPWRDVPTYAATQVVANGQVGFSASESGFATNG